MRTVLLVLHRSRSSGGGVTEHVALLARALPSLGVRAVVSVPPGSPTEQALCGRAELVHEEPRGKQDALAALRYARLARRVGADVVHTHARPSDLWAGIGARLAGRAAVATLHAEPARLADGRVSAGLRGRAHGALLSRVHARTIAVARRIAELAVERLGLDRSRLRVVENGVDLDAAPRGPDARAAARARLSAREGEVAVGLVARFVDAGSVEKGHPDAVRAIAKLARERPEVVLHLVGDGASRPEVEALARDEGVLDRVRFHGEVADALSLLAGFDVALLASRSEGSPLFLLEALAAGLPCIATDVGGVADILGAGPAGVLVPAGEPGAIAAALASLSRAPGRRAELAVAARARAEERYGLGRFARETAAVYEEALARSSGPAAAVA